MIGASALFFPDPSSLPLFILKTKHLLPPSFPTRLAVPVRRFQGMNCSSSARAATRDQPAQVLRRLLVSPGIHQGPCAHDALSAKLVERAGFPFCIMGGFGVSAVRLGLPDAGLISYGEMLDQGYQITQAVSIPVIGDGDTGYGNHMNVKRTVKGYIRAGFAGILLEDQCFFLRRRTSSGATALQSVVSSSFRYVYFTKEIPLPVLRLYEEVIFPAATWNPPDASSFIPHQPFHQETFVQGLKQVRKIWVLTQNLIFFLLVISIADHHHHPPPLYCPPTTTSFSQKSPNTSHTHPPFQPQPPPYRRIQGNIRSFLILSKP